jgi:hypothetical protein
MAVASLAAALAAPAVASTVRADVDRPGTRVLLEDDAAEANQLAVRVPQLGREMRFRDVASPIDPQGKGCRALDASRVECRLKGAAYFELAVEAGGGDDEISSDIAEVYRGRKMTFVHLHGGSGSDLIDAGPAEDTIIPGIGEDTVRAGGGYDFIGAGTAPDGPDFYDGGRGGATVSYSERDTRTYVDADGVADDGAVGEGDNVRRIFGASGGSARDVYVGDDHRNFLFGGGGPDRLRGRGDRDAIVGDSGADRIDAGPGADWVLDGGSAGADVIDCGPGNDFYEADPGDTVIACERSLVGPRAANVRARMHAAKP